MMDESVDKTTGLGKRLKQAREGLHLSVKEAAVRLHLNANVIQILEAEEFKSSLPPTFVRGYLRSYGRLLNIPDQEISAALEQLDITPKPTAIDVTSMLATAETQKDSRYVQWTTYSVISVLIVLVGFWWTSHSHNAGPQLLSEEAPAAAPQNKPMVVTAPIANSPISIPTAAPATTTTATSQTITTAKPPVINAPTVNTASAPETAPAPVPAAPVMQQNPQQNTNAIAAQATPPATPPTAQPSQPPVAASANTAVAGATSVTPPVPQPSAAPLAGQLNPLQQQPPVVAATTPPPTTTAPERSHRRSHRSELLPEPGISDD